MKPYVIQTFKNNFGETKQSRLITPERESEKAEEISGAEAVILPENGTVYYFGELTALTLSGFPTSGSFTVIFTSGTTATVLTVPAGLTMPDGFAVEANTRYEINVRNGYALCAGWAVNAS